MHPLAGTLNEHITNSNKHVYDMLSLYGKRIYFPSAGILTQSKEAKEKATRFNATIGIATEHGHPMALPSLASQIPQLDTAQYLSYASSYGLPELRSCWKKQQALRNPLMKNLQTSLPIVTNALTHGLSLAGSLFIDPEDPVVMPAMSWGNYTLLFETTLGAHLVRYPLFKNNVFNQHEFEAALKEATKGKEKIVVLFNAPHNPTGYAYRKNEVEPIIESLLAVAEQGTNIVAICDDAYAGLWFEEDVFQESLFGKLATLHKRILAIKIDGATKEEYAWGLRCGFVTYGNKTLDEKGYQALEDKSAGAIRATISNVSHLGQRLVLNTLNSETYGQEKNEKFYLLHERYKEIKRVLGQEQFKQDLELLPCNAGYFLTLHIKGGTSAFSLREQLLEEKQIGVIAIDDSHIRIAFSCLEKDEIEALCTDILEMLKS